MATLVVPLGTESKFNNDELKILLRSIDVNARNVGRVVVATMAPPKWLRNVEIIPIPDTLRHNKDGNIITKLVEAIKVAEIQGTVVWSCDDHVLLKPMDFEKLPTVFNRHKRSDFANSSNTWYKRMIRTFDFLASRGIRLECNYDSHTFQAFDAAEILRVLQGVDYAVEHAGYNINTLLKGLVGVSGGVVEQDSFKTTHESDASGQAPMDRPYVGYNDNAFSHGLRERLFNMFPEKSRYEE